MNIIGRKGPALRCRPNGAAVFKVGCDYWSYESESENPQVSFVFHDKLVISVMFYNQADAAAEIMSFLEASTKGGEQRLRQSRVCRAARGGGCLPRHRL